MGLCDETSPSKPSASSSSSASGADNHNDYHCHNVNITTACTGVVLMENERNESLDHTLTYSDAESSDSGNFLRMNGKKLTKSTKVYSSTPISKRKYIPVSRRKGNSQRRRSKQLKSKWKRTTSKFRTISKRQRNRSTEHQGSDSEWESASEMEMSVIRRRLKGFDTHQLLGQDSMTSDGRLLIDVDENDEEIEEHQIPLKQQLEKTIADGCAKNNLSVMNVKNILRSLVTHDLVQEMLRTTLKAGSEDMPSGAIVYEPKLTRAKMKEVLEKGKVCKQDPRLWPVSPVKLGQHTAAGPSILDVEFAEEEDEEDDEYEPSKDAEDADSDEESIVSSQISDIGSPLSISSPATKTCSSTLATPTPSVPTSPMHTPTPTATPVTPMTLACIVQETLQSNIVQLQTVESPMGPPKAPPPVSNKAKQRLHFSSSNECLKETEEDAIARRTRSKLPLTTTSLYDIEEAFVAPDITPDMYDTLCDDGDWQDFLQSLHKSAATDPQNESLEVAEEDDPEFNYIAEAETEEVEAEEVRFDGPFRISRKELNTLLEELEELFNEDDYSMIGLRTNLASAHENAALLSKKTMVTVCENEGSETLSSSRKLKSRGKEENTEISHQPAPVNLPEFIPMVLEHQVRQIEQQMRKHIQLTTQMYILAKGSDEFDCIADDCQKILKELDRFRGISAAASQSSYNVCNLNGALKIIDRNIDWAAYRQKKVLMTSLSNPYVDSALSRIGSSASSSQTLATARSATSAGSSETQLTSSQSIKESDGLSASEVDCSETSMPATCSSKMKTYTSASVLDAKGEQPKRSGKSHNNAIARARLPLLEIQKEVMWNSPVFLYPFLLPTAGLVPLNVMKNVGHKAYFNEWEDRLLVIGKEQFKNWQGKTFQMIHQYMMPCKTPRQLQHHYNSSWKKKDSTIGRYRQTRELPKIPQDIVFRMDMIKAPCDQPLSLLPSWCKTFQMHLLAAKRRKEKEERRKQEEEMRARKATQKRLERNRQQGPVLYTSDTGEKVQTQLYNDSRKRKRIDSEDCNLESVGEMGNSESSRQSAHEPPPKQCRTVLEQPERRQMCPESGVPAVNSLSTNTQPSSSSDRPSAIITSKGLYVHFDFADIAKIQSVIGDLGLKAMNVFGEEQVISREHLFGSNSASSTPQPSIARVCTAPAVNVEQRSQPVEQSAEYDESEGASSGHLSVNVEHLDANCVRTPPAAVVDNRYAAHSISQFGELLDTRERPGDEKLSCGTSQLVVDQEEGDTSGESASVHHSNTSAQLSEKSSRHQSTAQGSSLDPGTSQSTVLALMSTGSRAEPIRTRMLGAQIDLLSNAEHSNSRNNLSLSHYKTFSKAVGEYAENDKVLSCSLSYQPQDQNTETRMETFWNKNKHLANNKGSSQQQTKHECLQMNGVIKRKQASNGETNSHGELQYPMSSPDGSRSICSLRTGLETQGMSLKSCRNRLCLNACWENSSGSEVDNGISSVGSNQYNSKLSCSGNVTRKDQASIGTEEENEKSDSEQNSKELRTVCPREQSPDSVSEQNHVNKSLLTCQLHINMDRGKSVQKPSIAAEELGSLPPSLSPKSNSLVQHDILHMAMRTILDSPTKDSTPNMSSIRTAEDIADCCKGITPKMPLNALTSFVNASPSVSITVNMLYTSEGKSLPDDGQAEDPSSTTADGEETHNQGETSSHGETNCQGEASDQSPLSDDIVSTTSELRETLETANDLAVESDDITDHQMFSERNSLSREENPDVLRIPHSPESEAEASGSGQACLVHLSESAGRVERHFQLAEAGDGSLKENSFSKPSHEELCMVSSSSPVKLESAVVKHHVSMHGEETVQFQTGNLESSFEVTSSENQANNSEQFSSMSLNVEAQSEELMSIRSQAQQLPSDREISLTSRNKDILPCNSNSLESSSTVNVNSQVFNAEFDGQSENSPPHCIAPGFDDNRSAKSVSDDGSTVESHTDSCKQGQELLFRPHRGPTPDNRSDRDDPVFLRDHNDDSLQMSAPRTGSVPHTSWSGPPSVCSSADFGIVISVTMPSDEDSHEALTSDAEGTSTFGVPKAAAPLDQTFLAESEQDLEQERTASVSNSQTSDADTHPVSVDHTVLSVCSLVSSSSDFHRRAEENGVLSQRTDEMMDQAEDVKETPVVEVDSSSTNVEPCVLESKENTLQNVSGRENECCAVFELSDSLSAENTEVSVDRIARHKLWKLIETAGNIPQQSERLIPGGASDISFETLHSQLESDRVMQVTGPPMDSSVERNFLQDENERSPPPRYIYDEDKAQAPCSSASYCPASRQNVTQESHDLPLGLPLLGLHSETTAGMKSVTQTAGSQNPPKVFATLTAESPTAYTLHCAQEKSPTLRVLAPKTGPLVYPAPPYVPRKRRSSSSPKKQQLQKRVRAILPKGYTYEIKMTSPTKAAARTLKRRATLFCQRSPNKLLLPKERSTASMTQDWPMTNNRTSALPSASSHPRMARGGASLKKKKEMLMVVDRKPSLQRKGAEEGSQEESDETGSEVEDVAMLSQEDSQNEEDAGEAEDDEGFLSDLMAASTTIGFNPYKKSNPEECGSRKDMRRAQKLALLAPDVLETDPRKDDRDTAFAQAFLNKVKVTMQKEPNTYNQFMDLLRQFEEKQVSPVQVYESLSCLLRNYPDLLEEFSGFLLPNQALETCCHIPNQLMHDVRAFLKKLELHYDSAARPKYQQILRTLGKWNFTTKSPEQLWQMVMPLLRSLPKHLHDDFIRFFPDLRPSARHMEGQDFEDINLNDSDTNGNNSPDDFEDIKFPEENDPYRTRHCPCSCHQEMITKRTQERITHCYNCCLKVMGGQLYFQPSNITTRRPVSVTFHEPVPMPLPPHPLPPSTRTFSNFQQSSTVPEVDDANDADVDEMEEEDEEAILDVEKENVTANTKPVKPEEEEEKYAGKEGKAKREEEENTFVDAGVPQPLGQAENPSSEEPFFPPLTSDLSSATSREFMQQPLTRRPSSPLPPMQSLVTQTPSASHNRLLMPSPVGNNSRMRKRILSLRPGCQVSASMHSVTGKTRSSQDSELPTDPHSAAGATPLPLTPGAPAPRNPPLLAAPAATPWAAPRILLSDGTRETFSVEGPDNTVIMFNPSLPAPALSETLPLLHEQRTFYTLSGEPRGAAHEARPASGNGEYGENVTLPTITSPNKNIQRGNFAGMLQRSRSADTATAGSDCIRLSASCTLPTQSSSGDGASGKPLVNPPPLMSEDTVNALFEDMRERITQGSMTDSFSLQCDSSSEQDILSKSIKLAEISPSESLMATSVEVQLGSSASAVKPLASSGARNFNALDVDSIEWSREQDKLILEMVRDHGDSESTYVHIASRLQHRTPQQISQRVATLVDLLGYSSEDVSDGEGNVEAKMNLPE